MTHLRGVQPPAEGRGARYHDGAQCLSGDAWGQPGDLAAAWSRWVGVTPAGMERAGGAGSFDTGVLRSAGGNLMPSNDNVGLDLKHPINHVRVTALLDQLDG